jgi:hypothetical protein
LFSKAAKRQQAKRKLAFLFCIVKLSDAVIVFFTFIGSGIKHTSTDVNYFFTQSTLQELYSAFGPGQSAPKLRSARKAFRSGCVLAELRATRALQNDSNELY